MLICLNVNLVAFSYPWKLGMIDIYVHIAGLWGGLFFRRTNVPSIYNGRQIGSVESKLSEVENPKDESNDIHQRGIHPSKKTS